MNFTDKQVFDDKDLICRDCGQSFVFSSGEQEFFSLRGLINEPKRCSNCRVVARVQRSDKPSKQIAEVACADCAAMTKVPFQPTGVRPVYCANCLRERKRRGELTAVD